MIKAYRAWQKRRLNAQYERGWDWAAGTLLAGVDLEDIEARADYGKDFDGPNEFDRGIREACVAWVIRKLD